MAVLPQSTPTSMPSHLIHEGLGSSAYRLTLLIVSGSCGSRILRLGSGRPACPQRSKRAVASLANERSEGSGIAVADCGRNGAHRHRCVA